MINLREDLQKLVHTLGAERACFEHLHFCKLPSRKEVYPYTIIQRLGQEWRHQTYGKVLC